MSITDIQAENIKLKLDNEELKTRIYALRLLLALPLPVVEQTVDDWHKLLDKQDRDRPPGELPDFRAFMKDTNDAKL